MNLMAQKVAAILLFLQLYSVSSAQQEQCPSFIGNTNETAAEQSRDQFFYLDTDNPAKCAGSVTSWRVCYYYNRSIEGYNHMGAYWATYAVYHWNQSNNTYMRVSKMFRAIRTAASVSDLQAGTDGEINDGFNCYNDTIDAPLIIQAGDILGACVFNPPDDRNHVIRLPLHVVSAANQGGQWLRELKKGTIGCSIVDIPSVISPRELSSKPKILHIHAIIATEPGDEPATVTATVLVTLPPPTESAKGSQRALIVALSVVGSVCGGLLLLVAITICLTLQKWKSRKFSANQNSTNLKPGGNNIAIGINVASKSALYVMAGNARLEITHGNTKQPQSTENDSVLDVQQNVAYGSFTDDRSSSMVSNALYAEVGKRVEESCDNENDNAEYDYILD